MASELDYHYYWKLDIIFYTERERTKCGDSTLCAPFRGFFQKGIIFDWDSNQFTNDSQEWETHEMRVIRIQTMLN